MKKPLVLVAVILGLLALGVATRIHRAQDRARHAAIAAGMSPDRAGELTGTGALTGALAGGADHQRRAEDRRRQAMEAELANHLDGPAPGTRPGAATAPRAGGLAAPGTSAAPRALPRQPEDAASPFDALLAKGDLAGAQALLPQTGQDAPGATRRGRFYDHTGKDQRALAELQAAVAAGGSRPQQAEALAALAEARLRQGDHVGAREAAERALALQQANDAAYRVAAETARRDERWQDVVTLLDRHARQVDVADFQLRLHEARLALHHQGLADNDLDRAAELVAQHPEAPHAAIRLGLAAPYDRGLGRAASAYREALAGGWNDLEMHLLGAELAARQKDGRALEAAVKAASASGVRDARLWYWQGRAADMRNDSELADAMYARARARDPHFDPVALAWLHARR